MGTAVCHCCVSSDSGEVFARSQTLLTEQWHTEEAIVKRPLWLGQGSEPPGLDEWEARLPR